MRLYWDFELVLANVSLKVMVQQLKIMAEKKLNHGYADTYIMGKLPAVKSVHDADQKKYAA